MTESKQKRSFSDYVGCLKVFDDHVEFVHGGRYTSDLSAMNALMTLVQRASEQMMQEYYCLNARDTYETLVRSTGADLLEFSRALADIEDFERKLAKAKVAVAEVAPSP